MRVNARQLIAASATLALVAAVTVLAQSGAGQRELRRIGIVGAADKYSELAFATPAKLPTTLRSSSTVHVAFTVTNHERAALSYGWQLLQANHPPALVSGQLDLSQGQQAYLDPAIVPVCSGRTRFSVVLSSGQQISFWSDCVRPPAPPRRARSTRARRAAARPHKPRSSSSAASAKGTQPGQP